MKRIVYKWNCQRYLILWCIRWRYLTLQRNVLISLEILDSLGKVKRNVGSSSLKILDSLGKVKKNVGSRSLEILDSLGYWRETSVQAPWRYLTLWVNFCLSLSLNKYGLDLSKEHWSLIIFQSFLPGETWLSRWID